jgi:hypothetical protein
MKKNVIFLFLATLSFFASCSDDDNSSSTANSVAFVNSSVNLVAAETTVSVVFEKPTSSSGSLSIAVNPTNAVYGVDFTTNPEIVSNVLTIPYAKNVSNVTFTFNRIVEAVEGQIKNVEFTITNSTDVDLIISSTSKSTKLNFDESPIEMATVSPAVGGANVTNQVYVDLSSGVDTPINRASWDLGFYSGEDFRVVINGSIKMAVKETTSTDITQNVEIDNTVAIGEGGGTGVVNGNPAYVDNPNGDIAETAIASVSNILSANKVYLVNLGHAVSTVAPNVGSVNAYGDHRGWRKIRVLKSGNDYKLQYALPDATTFNEAIISKNAAYNFTFFSFNTNNIVNVEPEKSKWDLNFTSFANLTNFGSGFVSYAYQDFIVTNTKGGTRAYEVLNAAGTSYANFEIANVDNTKLDQNTFQDQRVIGSNWRNGGGPTTLPSAKDDRFYVLKDASGNIFKIRFISLTNASGERGNPTFEYIKLN